MSLSKFFLSLFFILSFLITQESHGAAMTEEESAAYDKKLRYHHGDSLLNYENVVHRFGKYWADDCFSTGKAQLFNAADFNNVCMPTTISKTPDPSCQSDVSARVTASQALRVVGYTALLSSPAVVFGAIALGIEYLIILDICTNAYVMTASEFINQKRGVTCKVDDTRREVIYDPESTVPALTEKDLQFFYHCDPNFDPKRVEWNADLHQNATHQVSNASNYAPSNPNFVGRTMGYMGAGSSYCSGAAATNARPELVGGAVAQILPGIFKVFGSYDYCTNRNRWDKFLKPGKDAYMYNANYYAYYKLFPDTGKIKMCVATPYTLFPVVVGCVSVAPPGDDEGIEAFYKNYVANTRCEYLIRPRSDLASVGKAIEKNIPTNSNEVGDQRKLAVAKFLQSDLHITSTVVGCVKDMLIKIFVFDPANPNEKPYFQVVQERLKQIVFSVLVLYVAIVGITIMTSPQVPQRQVFIMWVIKYGVVSFFALGNALYAVENGRVVGLFPSIIQSSEVVANIFMEAQNKLDPRGYCTYNHTFPSGGQKNILGENDLTASGGLTDLVNTAGYSYVKMSFWDLMDCKIINYLNGGTCEFGVGGLILVWIASIGTWFGANGVVLAITTFLYCFVLLLIFFKFAHIFILSAIVLTVLLFLTPIFVCFMLFEATKGIFQQWIKQILGYILYPSLLFAFMALMLATLDSIYYGPVRVSATYTLQDLAADPNRSITVGGMLTATDACQGVSSIFCELNNVFNFDQNYCKKSTESSFRAMTERRHIEGLNKDQTTVKKDIGDKLMQYMVSLMLFVFLFYLFMDTISQFMASLLGVSAIDSSASVSAFSAVGSVVGLAGKGGGKLLDAISKRKGGDKDGKGKEGEGGEGGK